VLQKMPDSVIQIEILEDYKDIPVCQIADKIRVMIMELFLEEMNQGEAI
jgi:hypothetical protein